MDNNVKTVDSVVVTYNRLELLKENLEKVSSQTYPIRNIYIIDNNSSDGTAEYLNNIDDPRFKVIRLTKNIGGAGGFSKGIELCAVNHADWIWMMDDDTIPEKDSLEQLMAYSDIEDVGYVNSQVLWTDGQPHLMNKPRYLEDQSPKETLFKENEALSGQCQLTHHSSFVSLLIKGSIPWELGLPLKEFFIWSDDEEYTYRITNAGYRGLHVNSSIVWHKTKTNYAASINTLTADMAWKLYYGERNGSYVRRMQKGYILFFLSQINEIRLHVHKIKKRHLPKADEKKLLHAIRKGLLDGFFFNPKICFPTSGHDL